MTETYQPIYDAVRSKLSNCDIGRTVEETLRQMFDFSSQVAMIVQDWQNTAMYQQRPSVLYRPSVGIDGNKWSALYGANLMEGVCGFGDSPEEAMRDFDKNWTTKIGATP